MHDVFVWVHVTQYTMEVRGKLYGVSSLCGDRGQVSRHVQTAFLSLEHFVSLAILILTFLHAPWIAREDGAW